MSKKIHKKVKRRERRKPLTQPETLVPGLLNTLDEILTIEDQELARTQFCSIVLGSHSEKEVLTRYMEVAMQFGLYDCVQPAYVLLEPPTSWSQYVYGVALCEQQKYLESRRLIEESLQESRTPFKLYWLARTYVPKEYVTSEVTEDIAEAIRLLEEASRMKDCPFIIYEKLHRLYGYSKENIPKMYSSYCSSRVLR